MMNADVDRSKLWLISDASPKLKDPGNFLSIHRIKGLKANSVQ